MSGMWRYLSGPKPPETKKRKTSEEKLDIQRKYEKERKREFQQSWLSGRPWLLHKTVKNDVGSMYCTLCIEASTIDNTVKVKNSFIAGCSTFKLETVKAHQVSSNHIKSRAIIKAREEPLATKAHKIVCDLNKDVVDKLKLLFRTAHALAYHNRPYTDYEWVCKLDRSKGLDVGKTYMNNATGKLFTAAIADIERHKLSEAIDKAKYVTILSDGSTDSSIKEQELFFVRYCDRGQVYVKFMACMHVERPDSASIFRAMQQAFTTFLGKSWVDVKTKLVGLGCDGAAVMTGNKTGLITLIQKEVPHVVLIHCFAHRLELAFKDASKVTSLHEKVVTTLLMGLYYYYHRSSVNRAMLRRSAVVLELQLRIPTRIGGTRWVGHLHRAIESVLISYPAIIQHLQQMTSTDSRPTNKVQVNKARCFLKLLSSRDVIQYLHLLYDVSDQLKRLSATFQQKTSSASDVHRCLKSAHAVLQTYLEREGAHLKKVINADTFCGTTLSRSDGSFAKARREMCNALQTAMEKRFSDTHKGVIRASEITKLSSWPPQDEKTEIQEFGVAAVETVVNHYKLEMDTIQDEWLSLKTIIYDEIESEDIKDLTWPVINRKYGQGHEAMLSLVDLLLCLPASSAEVERGFSQMKLIKTKIRSSLSDPRLNDLMTIKLLSTPVEDFDPMPAIEFWNRNSVRPRRPMLKDRPITSATVTGEKTTVMDSDANVLDEVQVLTEAEVVDEASPVPQLHEPEIMNSTWSDSECDSGLDSNSDEEEELVNKLIEKYQ